MEHVSTGMPTNQTTCKVGRRPNDALWIATLDRFMTFRREHGRFPSLGANGAETALARWFREQHLAYREGRLSDVRLAALRATPDWTWRRPPNNRLLSEDRYRGRVADDEKWRANLERFLAFIRANGRHPIPHAAEADERFIANWGYAQRHMRRIGTLLPSREAVLDATDGWTWEPPKAKRRGSKRGSGLAYRMREAADTWQDAWAMVQDYQGRHERWPVRGCADDAEATLGIWVARQIEIWERGHLSRDKISALSAHPAWIWPRKGSKSGASDGAITSAIPSAIPFEFLGEERAEVVVEDLVGDQQ